MKCYEESKLRDRAIKTVNQAAQLCTAGDVPLTVKEEILRLRIQLHASIPDAILKIRSEFPAVSSSTPGYEIAMHLRAVFILQCINWYVIVIFIISILITYDLYVTRLILKIR